MKKKLTITNLALGNLKQRKKQYTTLIIGIVLAMFFSSSVLFFVSCLISSNEEHDKRTVGNFYGYFYSPEEFLDAEKGKEDGYIEQYGYAHIVGYAYADEEKQDKGTPIAWLDEDAKELYYLHFLEGNYPENVGEIAIEKDVAMRLGFEPVLGEKITLSVLTPDGYDYLPDAEEKTYTITGILSDKRKNIERTMGVDGVAPMAAAFVCEKEEIPVGGKENLALYFNPTEESMKETIDEFNQGFEYKTSPFDKYFIKEIYAQIEKVTGLSIEYRNNDFMRGISTSNYEHNEAVYNSSFLTITLAAVLMVASCIGIVNAFTTNLQERKKQIGLLRAVGATKRQIINIFGREAFIITLISAPICVLISYFGVKLFATLMGDAFIFIPNMFVLLGSTAVSVICVMLAAIIPLFYASRTSPMQAIRNVELSRKMTRRKIRQQKNFKVPTLLAKRSLKFYKSKQVGVSIILTLTIILTCFGFSLLKAEFQDSEWYSYNTSDYVVRRSSYPDRSGYVNMPEIDKGITLNEVQAVNDYPVFNSVYGYKECKSYIICDEYSEYMNLLQYTWNNTRYQETSVPSRTIITDDLTSEELFDIWFDGESDYYKKIKQNSGTEQEMFQLDILAYDPEIIENNINKFEVIDGKIDIEKLNSGEEIIIMAYEEIGFTCDFGSDGHLSSYGVWDLTKENLEKLSNEGRKIYATATLDYNVGDKINLRTLYSYNTEYNWEEYEIPENIENVDKEVTVGAIVKPISLGDYLAYHSYMGIFTTVNGMHAITNHQHGYETLCIDIKGENDDETDKDATEYLTSVFSGSYFKPLSGYAVDKDSRSMAQILLIAMLSVIILFFSICASIVNNSLTAKIRESKKEIGTLRAVGASTKELTESYIRQLISMFVWGGSFGFVGYIVAHFAIKIYTKGQTDIPFEIWQSAILFVLLLGICSLNLYLNVKKQMKHSIVENIREL